MPEQTPLPVWPDASVQYAGSNQPDPPGTPHVLDDLPPFHQKLLEYGERPYWSPDGKRIAFIEKNYGDVAEINLETRQVRHLTRNNGEHHAFLRVLFMHNGDYLLIGPKEFKDRHTSRHMESELWWMDADAARPPVPLGRRLFEGIGVSTIAPRITYAMNGHHDPALGVPERFAVHVTEINLGSDGPRLGRDQVIYHADGGFRPEPQDFRHDDSEVVMAEYIYSRRTHPDTWRCVVKGVDVATGTVRWYINEPGVHNECEGMFPDQEHICLESSVDTPPGYHQSIDLWKLKLDGSGRRARLTRFCERWPWRATNSNVSPDGRWLAFMLNRQGDEAGYGRGLGLLDLQAWEASPQSQAWGTAPVRDVVAP
ncbi:MAG TPA: hypothetical protein VGW38_15725 [Chloroflexota bacterium]|nr:hypothetical protein [Chloroflexota bacterium]